MLNKLKNKKIIEYLNKKLKKSILTIEFKFIFLTKKNKRINETRLAEFTLVCNLLLLLECLNSFWLIYLNNSSLKFFFCNY